MTPAPGRLAVVEPVGGQRRDLEERAAVVEEHVDPLAREQLAAGHVPLPRALRAAEGRGAEPVPQLGDEGALGRVVRCERGPRQGRLPC